MENENLYVVNVRYYDSCIGDMRTHFEDAYWNLNDALESAELYSKQACMIVTVKFNNILVWGNK